MTDSNGKPANPHEVARAREALGRMLTIQPLVDELRARAEREPAVIVPGAGIYTMDAAAYHADPCPRPSLSASVAIRLINRSPLHARQCHPRLVKFPTLLESTQMDIGTIVHALLLQGEDWAEVIDFPDYRTNAAKDARDKAREEGRTPILKQHWIEVQAMLHRFRQQIGGHVDGRQMFKGGLAEQTLVWQEDNGVWCRARLDYLREGGIDDYKSTSSSARFEDLEKRMREEWSLQAGFYLRGVAKLRADHQAVMRFAAQETYAPWAVSVVSPAPSMLALAERDIRRAIEEWGKSLATGVWRGYGDQTAYISAPQWYEDRKMAQEQADAV